MHPSLSRALQRHQEHNLKHPGSVDLITTKQNKTNYLPSQIRCSLHAIPSMSNSIIPPQCTLCNLMSLPPCHYRVQKFKTINCLQAFKQVNTSKSLRQVMCTWQLLPFHQSVHHCQKVVFKILVNVMCKILRAISQGRMNACL